MKEMGYRAHTTIFVDNMSIVDNMYTYSWLVKVHLFPETVDFLLALNDKVIYKYKKL